MLSCGLEKFSIFRLFFLIESSFVIKNVTLFSFPEIIINVIRNPVRLIFVGNNWKQKTVIIRIKQQTKASLLLAFARRNNDSIKSKTPLKCVGKCQVAKGFAGLAIHFILKS